MASAEIVIGEDGRIVSPKGLRLRLPEQFVVRDEPEQSFEERAERIGGFWKESDERLADISRRPWPKDDPIVEKFRRMGILEEE